MQLIKGTLQDFDNVFKDMLLQFPKEELKDKNHLIQLMREEKYDIWLAKNEGKTVAYIMICPYQEFLWLDYIAVLKEFHSMGYGSKILPLLKEVYPQAAGLFLEVEHESYKDPNTGRRIRFYTRLGAKLIMQQYLLPTKEGGFPMGLYFMSYGEEMPTEIQTKQTIQFIFETIHSDIPNRQEVFERIL